jgi:hypothetical protein
MDLFSLHLSSTFPRKEANKQLISAVADKKKLTRKKELFFVMAKVKAFRVLKSGLLRIFSSVQSSRAAKNTKFLEFFSKPPKKWAFRGDLWHSPIFSSVLLERLF